MMIKKRMRLPEIRTKIGTWKKTSLEYPPDWRKHIVSPTLGFHSDSGEKTKVCKVKRNSVIRNAKPQVIET